MVESTNRQCIQSVSISQFPDQKLAQPSAGILPSPRAVHSPRGESVGHSKELGARSLDWETPGLANKSQVGWDAHPTALVFVCLSAPALRYISVGPMIRPGEGV